VVNDVQRVYNAFAQLTSEYQSHSGAVNTGSTPRSQYAFADGSANTIRPISMSYPNGRLLNDVYGFAGGANDSASRIVSLVDNDGVTHLADYSYLGAGTIAQVDESQPHLSYTLIGTAGGNDPDTGDIYRGLDRFGRVKDLMWWNSATSTNSVRIQHGYDRAGNRLYRADIVAEGSSAGLDELYGYDGLYRVKNLQRGTLANSDSQIQNPKFLQCWTLDATGNWKGFRQDDTGSGTWNLIQSRSANPVNEITGIVNSAGPAWAQTSYDAAGNMTSVPKPTAMQSGFSATYDAWHRLVKLVDASSGQTVQTNAYDGLRRRTVRNTYTSGTLTETRHYFYSSAWQVLEERVGTSTSAERQFVWGLRYIDDLILRDRDTNADGVIDERLYALQDPNFNVVGLTDSSGTVQERYAYDAYGVPTVLTPTFGSRSSSNYGWETFYAGYRWDSATGLYLVRNRTLNPKTGTWEQRDPAGYVPDLNLFGYIAGSPFSGTDPSGLHGPPDMIIQNADGQYVGAPGTVGPRSPSLGDSWYGEAPPLWTPQPLQKSCPSMRPMNKDDLERSDYYERLWNLERSQGPDQTGARAQAAYLRDVSDRLGTFGAFMVPGGYMDTALGIAPGGAGGGFNVARQGMRPNMAWGSRTQPYVPQGPYTPPSGTYPLTYRWPRSVQEMNDMLGYRGTKTKSGTEWPIGNEGARVVCEQHNGDPLKSPRHAGQHWHTNFPNLSFPGYPGNTPQTRHPFVHYPPNPFTSPGQGQGYLPGEQMPYPPWYMRQ
jgi:RHS repeat-associated protein